MDYYFSRASSQPDNSSRSEPIVFVIDRKKRPVGESLKAAPTASSKRMKLVNYSSSSESELEKVSSTSRSTTKDKVIRKMYSVGQKKAVAEYARFHGIRAASRHFGVHHKNVSR